MKILYGVQCTGNGHLSRSREIVAGLKAMGHDVHVIFSGRDPAQLVETGVFAPYTALHGLAYVTRRGRIDYLATAATLNFPRFWRDIMSFDASRYDLAVTDFEPITSRIARRAGIPSVAIGHQYAFMYDIPTAESTVLARGVLKHFAPADTTIGLHWHHFDQPILPPVVPRQLRTGTVQAKKILVYLPFEHRSDVEPMLQSITTHDFHIYGPAVDRSDTGHLHWRGFSRSGFLADLHDCEGVICNAGFELPSEALQLGKRLLVKPVKSQMEQESNAHALEELGIGSVMWRLHGGAIRQWLETPGMVQPLRFPDVADRIVRWIDGGCREDIWSLASEMWAGHPRALLRRSVRAA